MDGWLDGFFSIEDAESLPFHYVPQSTWEANHPEMSLLSGMSEAVAAFPPHKLQTLRSTSQKRISPLSLAVNYCHH